VACSGVKGVSAVTIRLNKDKTSPRKYTVRLYFAEPDGLKVGQRRFDVTVQGKEVLQGFDIVKESGGPNKSLVREFKGVVAREELVIALRPTPGADGSIPLLSGIEIIAEDTPEKK
jgi:hypothetical protein